MGAVAKVGADQLMKLCAIRRYGRVQEIAQLLALCTDKKKLSDLNGYAVTVQGAKIISAQNASPERKHSAKVRAFVEHISAALT